MQQQNGRISWNIWKSWFPSLGPRGNWLRGVSDLEIKINDFPADVVYDDLII
jgi:hypothetical protein